MAKTKAEKAQGFEESLNSLEKIVAQLEAGDLPLERALEMFEDGVGLARRCQSQLADAERKVDMLLREHGELRLVPFDASRETQTTQTDKATSLPRIRRADENKDDENELSASRNSARELDDFDDLSGDDLDDDVPF